MHTNRSKEQGRTVDKHRVFHNCGPKFQLLIDQRMTDMQFISRRNQHEMLWWHAKESYQD